MTPLVSMRGALRALFYFCAAALAMFMAATQALAVLPAGWLGPTLQFRLSQAVVLRLGMLRDGLGVWNLVIGTISAVLAIRILWTATGHRRCAKLLIITSFLGFASAIATFAALILAVRRVGVAMFPLLPTLPFMGVGGNPDETVAFGKPGGTELRADLYLPTGDGKAHPVVVSIHGGGFTFGSRAPSAYTRFLADHGYVVMDIDYRLGTQDAPAWRTEVADVGCALTWVGTHATQYDMEPAKVAIFGESAGGNLAINAAYMANNATLEPACGTAAEIPNVRAAIGGFPAVDLTRGTRLTAIGRLVGRNYIGGSPEQYPEAYARVDSATQISAKSPPTLIFQGSRDHLVIVDPVRDFATLLSARGVVNSYVEYPGLDHGCGDAGNVLTYGTAASRLLILRWLNTYLKS